MKLAARSCLLALALTGCPSSPEPADGGPDAARPDAPRTPDAPAPFDAGPVVGEIYGAPGPYAVGNARATIDDPNDEGTRELVIEVWYPAVEAARAAATTGQPLADFEAGSAHEAAMDALVADSPTSCIRSTVHSALDAEPIADPVMLPAVVFSHCHQCMRFDVAEVSERLASHGIVVVAPDHAGNVAWDDPPATIGPAFLAIRAADVSATLDAILDGAGTALPAALVGRIDPAHVGVMGHSFGAATTGAVIASDERFVAAMAIAAPVTAIGSIDGDSLDVPYLFLSANQDNSVPAASALIEADWERVPGPAWIVDVEGAGHWSFTDIAGLGGDYTPGCAELDDRADYIDTSEGREIAADVAAAFFAHTLLGEADGEAFLATGFWSGPARVRTRP